MTISSFEALSLSPATLAAVLDAGYREPTAVQVAAVPAMLSGRDIVIQSQTGTGKTAAFVLPTVERIEPVDGRIEALVLVPTRELAQQVCNEFERLGKGRGIRAVAVFGGTGFEKQKEQLLRAHAVVATPGRLLDFIRRGNVSLGNVRFFGLDEADEMLSMGFEKDVLDIISHVPAGRQSFLCSATYNDPIRRIASRFIHDPLQVNTSSDQLGARSVRHVAFKVPYTDKYAPLRRLIVGRSIAGAIIFANTRAETFRITETLRADRHSVDVLNGDLSQAEREAALARMRDGGINFLVATDVAARGIDISGLPAVINFDMPDSADVYVHRTGRTGRAGQAGVAYSLVTPADVTVYHQLHKFFDLTFEEQTLPVESDLRRILADRALSQLLDGLDAQSDLDYAAFIPLARRLAEAADGSRTIAKLMAYFVARPEQTTQAVPVDKNTTDAPSRTVSPTVASSELTSPVAEPQPDSTAKPATSTSETRAPRQQGQPDRATPAQPASEASVPAPTVREPSSSQVEKPRREDRNVRESAPADSSAKPAPVTQAKAPHPERQPRDGAPRRDERRQRNPRDPRHSGGVQVVSAPSVTIDISSASVPSGALTADQIITWIRDNSPPRARARFHASDRIAQALAVSVDNLEAVATASSAIERSHGERAMWRLHPSLWAEADRVTGSATTTPAPVPPTARTTSAPRPANAPVPSRPSPEDKNGDLVSVRVNVGRGKVKSAYLLATELANISGFDPEDFHRVELYDRHSIMAVRQAYWQDIRAALQNVAVFGIPLQIARVSEA
jgi:ATP-dependent RNA helicase DeaD